MKCKQCIERTVIDRLGGDYCQLLHKCISSPREDYVDKDCPKNICPHCDFLSKTFIKHDDSTNREYWLMTEVFVYLHGKDSCDYLARQEAEHNV